MEVLQYVFYFLVILGVLVTFHEFGHFVVARWSGVKVVRFSVGFGRPLFSYTDGRGTEFVIAAIPLGGYVRMLDEREADVDESEAHLSFNRLNVWWRIAIALGGPAANFILAFLVYWLVFVLGTTMVVPVLGAVDPDTPAYRAGLKGGEEIVTVDGAETATWMQVNMALAGRLGDTGAIELRTRVPGGASLTTHSMTIETWHMGVDAPDLMGSLGLKGTLPAVVGEVVEDSAAAAAGFRRWDHVISANGESVADWRAWVRVIQNAPGERMSVEIERDGFRRTLVLHPDSRTNAEGEVFGFAGLGPLMRTIQYSPWQAIPRSFDETVGKTVLTLDLLKKMVTGLVSTRNLSGPITIAKVAGDSAKAGLDSFLSVLALLSISLGVLNLLPIPILDGGHILFCLAEVVTRKPVSARVQALGFQIGLFLVAGLMLLAFYNDLTRFL
ncbi:MAG: RIP metalloprotease RseP [Gammaproteobacteria bacterium]|nr:RIP metalloprotease RseP [Gammaproteobacteria bacterium]